MPKTTKNLLIILLVSIVILILSWIFRPLEPGEQDFEENQNQENMIDLDALPEI